MATTKHDVFTGAKIVGVVAVIVYVVWMLTTRVSAPWRQLINASPLAVAGIISLASWWRVHRASTDPFVEIDEADAETGTPSRAPGVAVGTDARHVFKVNQ